MFRKIISVVTVLCLAAWVSSAQAALIEVVTDGGFEGGRPNPNWDETSTNFGTPVCTIAICGTGTGTGPHTGDYWAWFGGVSADESASLAQDVTILLGSSATLSFYYEVAVANSATAVFEILLGGVSIFSDNSNQVVGAYSLMTFDVSSFADGGTYSLQINGTTLGEGITNFFIDDVSILVETDRVSVPAPSGFSLMGLGLFALWLRRKA